MATMQSYFSHDSNARNDEKMIRVRMKHGVAGYGIFFMLLERLKEEADYTCAADYQALAFDFRADANLIKSVVEDFGLFEMTEQGERFFSQAFKERMAIKDEARASISEERRNAANKRWHKNDANAMQMQEKEMQTQCNSTTETMQNDANKSKVKESKEKEIKTKEISSSSNAHEGADEGRESVFKFGISLDFRETLKEICKKETPEDFNEALRLCSWALPEGREKAGMVLKTFETWYMSREKTHQPFYMAIQAMQAMEQRGQINPPSRSAWRVYAWVMTLQKRDRDSILRLAKTEEDLETINECMKECNNSKKKIDNPGRYTIAALNKTK